MELYHVRSFYQFKPLVPGALPGIVKQATGAGERAGVRGLVLLAAEGCNGTVSGGDPAALDAFLAELAELTGLDALEVKASTALEHPFGKLKILIRDEIVTTGEPKVQLPEPGNYLSPEEWEAMLGREDVVVLDVRNKYETKIGKFRDAVEPEIDSFQQFPEFVRRWGVPRDKTVLMYCTGGIRCEKAIVQMREGGYSHVYQLHGGILSYLERFPNRSFEGECFVFDNRVALDQSLRPSAKYRFCAHCGDPTESMITCRQCATTGPVCESCRKITHRNACSKVCANRLQAEADAGDNVSGEIASKILDATAD